MHHHLLEDFMQAFNILHENGLQNKPFTKKHSPWKRSTKQACHQKKKRSTHKKNKYPRKQSNYKTNLSPNSILHENVLQNKPFTKKHCPWKRSTKQAFHQRTFSKKMVYKTNCSPKKRVYKTNLSPKQILQEIGLQNKLFTKKTSLKKGLQNKPSIKKNSRKRSTKKALATNVPQENAQHKGLGPKHAEDQTILVICRRCVKWSISLLLLDKKMIFFIMMEYPRMEIPGWQLYASWTTIS